MSKITIITSILFLGALAQARICPNNDFKACSAALSKSHRAGDDKAFRATYDDICSSNSKFKCTKVTVMAEPEATKKELASEKPKALLFIVQHDDGKYIYSFEKR